MIIFLSTIIALLAVGHIYVQWKLVNLERNCFMTFNITKSLEEDWLKIKRSFTKSQAETYIDQQCVKCKGLLPEGTLKSIDGHKYCPTCKLEVRAQLQKLIDGFNSPAEVIANIN